MKSKSEKIKFLSPDEISKLIRSIKSKRDKAIFLIAYRHALRASEVGLLRASDIDWQNFKIRVTRLKGSLDGVHPLQADEARILKQWIKEAKEKGLPDTYLFPTQRGLPIGRIMLHVLMKKYCKAAGIAEEKAHFHALKHSIATHLLNADRDLREVQDWLGHKEISNTVIYTHLSTAKRESMAREAFQKLPKF